MLNNRYSRPVSLLPEQVAALNTELDAIFLAYPEGVTHRTRGEVMGKIKDIVKALGIQGESWLPDILKLRKIR